MIGSGSKSATVTVSRRARRWPSGRQATLGSVVRSSVAMPARPMGGRTIAASTLWSRRPAVGSVKSYSTLFRRWSGRHPLGDPDRVVEVVEHLGDQAGEDAAGLGQLDGPGRSLEKGDLKLP